MKPWTITSFSGVNNMNDVAALEQPDYDKYKSSGSGATELVKSVNFDIDDDGGLIQRDSTQAIFTAEYDAKLTQTFAGRTWTVDGKNLHFTKPWSSSEEERRSIISYSNPIIMIQEIEQGMWVSTTERIFFHRGRNPAVVGGFTQVAEYDYPAIAGTQEKVSATKLKLDSDGFVAVFATTKGICYGTDSGKLVNMSEGVYSYKPGQRGISTVKEANGLVQYIVKMINPSDDSYNPNVRKEDIVVDTI